MLLNKELLAGEASVSLVLYRDMVVFDPRLIVFLTPDYSLEVILLTIGQSEYTK